MKLWPSQRVYMRFWPSHSTSSIRHTEPYIQREYHDNGLESFIQNFRASEELSIPSLPQTKLHDTVCKRRRVATIATHDLSKVSLPLTYSCAPADAITMLPLGGSSPLTVQEFLGRLEANRADKGAGRKAKPVDPAAAVLSK